MGDANILAGHKSMPLVGRFWALADESSDGEDQEALISDLAGTDKYILNSNSSNDGSSSSRKSRRENKRNLQCWAARELAISPSRSKDVFTSDRAGRSDSGKKLPMLLPSTFVLEDFNVKEWIMITRRERKKKEVNQFCQSSGKFEQFQVPAIDHLFRRSSIFFEKSDVYGCKAHNISDINILDDGPNRKVLGPLSLILNLGTRPIRAPVWEVLGFRSERYPSSSRLSFLPKCRPRGLMAGRGMRPPTLMAGSSGSF
jgi:hypothetical protein